jgi:hypothetical protein
MALTSSCRRPKNVCVDMEPRDVMLTEGFTLYNAMSALVVEPLEAMRTRSNPRLLFILVLFRSGALTWTAVLFWMGRQSDRSLIRLLLSYLKKFVIY